jgi:hypothetical protein
MADVEKPETKPSPEEEDDDERSFTYNGIPEDDAWFLSRWLFMWEGPLFKRANQLGKIGRALEQDDLMPLTPGDYSEVIGPKFDHAWKKREKQQEEGETSIKKLEDLKGDAQQHTRRLRNAILEVMGVRFWIAGLIKLINSLLQFSFPLLLNAILKFIQETDAGVIPPTAPGTERYKGYWLSAILLSAMAGKSITENAFYQRVYRCGFHAKTAVSVAVYEKSLRLTNAERQSTNMGK